MKEFTFSSQISLKSLQTLALTKQAMCISVSPYIPGEAITVTETGRVYLWSCEHSLRTVHQPSHVKSNDFPWYQCVFAANPRCIAMADAKGMDLLDFRVSNLSLMYFLFFFRNVYLVAVQYFFFQYIFKMPSRTYEYLNTLSAFFNLFNGTKQIKETVIILYAHYLHGNIHNLNNGASSLRFN